MIRNGRLDRRELMKLGMTTAGLAMIPELRAVEIERPDLRFDATYVATQCLSILEENLPKLDRAFAGFGNDGDKITLEETDYELQQQYVCFELDPDQEKDVDSEKFVHNYLMPVAYALANAYKNQPNLKHLISRRIEPAPGNTGVVSHFAFHDSMGLRATIGYSVLPKPRYIYSIDMLMGVQREETFATRKSA